eukprot:216497-Chlamydomonas_euryale.AAC.2
MQAQLGRGFGGSKALAAAAGVTLVASDGTHPNVPSAAAATMSASAAVAPLLVRLAYDPSAAGKQRASFVLHLLRSECEAACEDAGRVAGSGGAGGGRCGDDGGDGGGSAPNATAHGGDSDGLPLWHGDLLLMRQAVALLARQTLHGRGCSGDGGGNMAARAGGGGASADDGASAAGALLASLRAHLWLLRAAARRRSDGGDGSALMASLDPSGEVPAGKAAAAAAGAAAGRRLVPSGVEALLAAYLAGARDHPGDAAAAAAAAGPLLRVSTWGCGRWGVGCGAGVLGCVGTWMLGCADLGVEVWGCGRWGVWGCGLWGVQTWALGCVGT